MAQETEHRLPRNQFTKAMRGYSCEEVDAYVAYINDRYTALAKECSDLKKKMTVVAAGQNEFRDEALREKEQIAAEAQAMVQEKQALAERLMHDAKRKAARILSEAEEAAAGILKKAEAQAAATLAEADETLQNAKTEAEEALRQVEGYTAKQEAAAAALEEAHRKIAQRNNVADRMVEEIDTFRDSIFAMYAQHIEELERLGNRIEEFYQAKEALTEEIPLNDSATTESSTSQSPAEEMAVEENLSANGTKRIDDAANVAAGSAETAEDGTANAIPETADYARIADTFVSSDEAFQEDDDSVTDTDQLLTEDLLRIDWKKRRANRTEGLSLSEEEDQSADQSADPSDDPSADPFANPSANQSADPEEDQSADPDAPEYGFTPNPDALAFLNGFTETDPTEESADGQKDWEDGSESEEEPFSGASFAEAAAIAESAVPDDERAAVDALFDETAAVDSLFEVQTESKHQELQDEDDFLSDLASEYITPAKKQTGNGAAKIHTAEDALDDAEQLTPVRHPVSSKEGTKASEPSADLDTLFYEEKKAPSSLTDEFDIIFSSKKSAAHVTEIGQQPLVSAQKPEKPKKRRG